MLFDGLPWTLTNTAAGVVLKNSARSLWSNLIKALDIRLMSFFFTWCSTYIHSAASRVHRTQGACGIYFQKILIICPYPTLQVRQWQVLAILTTWRLNIQMLRGSYGGFLDLLVFIYLK